MSNMTEREFRLVEEKVASRDPLNCDYLFVDGTLPRLNQSRDWQSLLAQTQALTQKYLERFSTFDQFDQLASIRDFGILIGSSLRHGKNPLDLVPKLKEALLLASEKSSSTPYHNVYHYSLHNPSGLRERTFTGTREESKFIAEVKKGILGFTQCSETLLPIFLGDISLSDPSAIKLISQALAGIDLATTAIPQVMKDVGPEFFAKNLRPYFDPISLNGLTYDAPGGSQMPLLLIDHLVWASDTNESDYLEFRQRNLIYLPKTTREMITSTIDSPSISTKTRLSEDISSELKSVTDLLLKRIYSFRKAHGKLAKESFKHRSYGEVGSGGSTPDLLDTLTSITRSKSA